MTVGKCRKLWQCLQKTLTNSSGKFCYFYKKIWWFLPQNLTSFAWMRIIVIKNTWTTGNKNQQILLQKASSFLEKSSNVPVKTARLSCKNRLTSLEKPLNFLLKVVGFSWKNCQIFLQKSSHFLSKFVKIFLLKLSTFPRKIERMHSIKWFQRTSVITRFKKF